MSVGDDRFSFADGEVVEARTVDRRELDAMLGSRSFCPDSIALALPLVEDRLARAKRARASLSDPRGRGCTWSRKPRSCDRKPAAPSPCRRRSVSIAAPWP